MKKQPILVLCAFIAFNFVYSQVNFDSGLSNRSFEIKEMINSYQANQAENNNFHHFKDAEQFGSATSDYGDPPDWSWVSQFGGSGDDHIRDIVTDTEGNIYVTGSFSGEIGVDENNFISIGNWDSFIAKFQDNGNLVWFKQVSASEHEEIISYGIHLDNSGNTYITGYYTGSVSLGTFDLPNVSNYNLFFAKVDETGNYLLAANHAPSNTAIGFQIDTDNSGNIYITGSANGSTGYNYPGLILKFDSFGNELINYVSDQNFSNIKVVDESIYILGRINTPGYLGDFYFAPVSYGDVFVAKTDLNLSFEWAYMAEHDPMGDSYCTDFYISDDENIYITGTFRTDIILGAHALQGQNGFIAKCSPEGGFLWLSDLPEDNFNGTPMSICGDDLSSYVSSFRNEAGNQINEIHQYHAISGSFYQMKNFENAVENICYSQGVDKIIATENDDELITLSQLDQSMEYIWSNPFEGNSAHGWIISTATDQLGNLYTYGYASNEINYFGQTISKGLFLAKQYQSGMVIWIKQFPDSYQYTGSGSDMITDTLFQSVYITTAFNSDFTMPNGTILEPGENGSTVIIKYDYEGNFQWVAQEDFMRDGRCLSSDYSGNILITGEFSGTINIGNTTLTALGGEDVFIAKYNSSGDFQWAIRAGGVNTGGHEYVEFISTDSDDNIYLTGEFTCVENTINNYQITLNEGDGNILLAKLDPSGNVLWATSKANSPISYGDGNCWPTGIQTTPDGYSYIKGWHGDSTYFDDILLLSPYGLGYSYFIAKFDPEGNTLWANSINQHWYGFDYNQMDIDHLGNVYMGAQIRDTVHFGDDFTYIPEGNYDLFVAKYLNDGELDWVKIMESSTSECWLSSIAVYNENVIFIGGRFNSYLNIGASTLTSQNEHGFVAAVGETVGIKVFERNIQSSMFELYPNPSQQSTFLVLNNDGLKGIDVIISDISGKCVFENHFDGSRQKIEISLAEFSKGLYLVKVKSGDQMEVKKLLIN